MRNIGGSLAQAKFARCLLASLQILKREYSWFHSKSKKWIEGNDDNDAGIEYDLGGLM